jgi:hypothetical protein
MTKCMSYLGFAGDIFSGQWDDSKYVQELTKEFGDKPTEKLDTTAAEKALTAAVKNGTDSLRKAWEQQPEAVRVALKDKLAEWKAKAKEWDQELAMQP